MSIRCGIVGLPNVGKSTLFNALTETAKAEAANYPFCTIEPNIGIVGVPDVRLDKLAKIASSASIIPVQIEFVDIAGLVRGASKGEGLGNKFLSHIREVDAIIHVLRCFEDEDITHVEGQTDPVRDAEIIETELMLADLESVEKRIITSDKKLRSGDKLIAQQVEILKKIKTGLEKGIMIKNLDFDEDEWKIIRTLQLITSKPMMYVCNVLESDATNGNIHTQKVKEMAEKNGANSTIISSKIEAEIALIPEIEEKLEFLKEMGLSETGLSAVIRSAYSLLNLESFFTIGPKEARAWTIRRQTLAPSAAGVIHTDFEKGFIKAEVISYEDYIKYNGESGAKEVGKMRLEGKEYTVIDGDVIHFRFNV